MTMLRNMRESVYDESKRVRRITERKKYAATKLEIIYELKTKENLFINKPSNVSVVSF